MANEFVARKGIISLGGLTFPYYQASANYTASTDDYFIDIIQPGAYVYLPTAVGIEGKQYVVRNSTSLSTRAYPVSEQYINELNWAELGAQTSIQIVSTGTDWSITSIGGPIKNTTNNGLLTSDGSDSGVNANSGITYDGVTLVQIQQNTGDTYSEIITFKLNNITVTSGTTGAQKVFSIPKSEVISCKCDYQISRTSGNTTGQNVWYRFGSCVAVPFSSNQSTLVSLVDRTAGGTGYTTITHTATTFNSDFYVRTSGSFIEIVDVEISCAVVKKQPLT
jgi:hypothetical protein